MIQVIFGNPTEFVIKCYLDCANCAMDLFRRQHCSLGVRLKIVNNPEQKS